MTALRERVRCCKKAVATRALDDLVIDVTDGRALVSSVRPVMGSSSFRSGSERSTTSEPLPRAPQRERKAPDPQPPSEGVTMRGATLPPSIGLELGAPNRFATADIRPDAKAGLPDRDPMQLMQPRPGPEAPVLEALCSATSASTAPVGGRAVFRAVADASGMVTALDVVDCDGGRSGWTEAAELARARLIDKRLATAGKRIEMSFELTSALKLPSGHDTGTNVSVFGVTTSKGQGKRSPSVRVIDILPRVQVVELAKDLKLPVVTYDPDVIAVSGDAANAGAKPRRVVHAKLLHSQVL